MDLVLDNFGFCAVMGWDENATETDCRVKLWSKAEPAIEVRAIEPEELARFERLLKEGHWPKVEGTN